MATLIDTATTSTVSAEQIAEYQRRGWIKLPQLITGEELEAVREAAFDAIERPDFKPAASAAVDQSRAAYQKILQVHRDLSSRYPAVDTLMRRLGPMMGELNSWKGTRLWQDRLFVKPGMKDGEAGRQTSWHQDLKVPFDRRGFATVWIALMDVPLSRGPMTFLNGSHRLGPLGSVDQVKHIYDLSELLNEQDWKVVDGCASGAPIAAGDATVHTCLTLHRAGDNTTKEDRVVIAISYFDAEQLYTCVPNEVTDGLGLEAFKPFDHENFPLVG